MESSVLDPPFQLVSLKSTSLLTLFPCREYTLADAQTLADTDAPSSPEDRDLDDEVPDADEEGEGGWIDEEDDEDDGHDVQGHPHNLYNGNGVVMVVDRDNIGMDAEGDDDYAQGERDLDDDIPEGIDGSYQHTDTDVEDESSSEEPEAQAQPSVLDHPVWGSGTSGAIGGVGENYSPSGGARGPRGRRSVGRIPGREN